MHNHNKRWGNIYFPLLSTQEKERPTSATAEWRQTMSQETNLEAIIFLSETLRIFSYRFCGNFHINTFDAIGKLGSMKCECVISRESIQKKGFYRMSSKMNSISFSEVYRKVVLNDSC